MPEAMPDSPKRAPQNPLGAKTDKVYNHGYSRGRTRRYKGVRPGGDVEGTPMNVTLTQIDEILNGLNDGELTDDILHGVDAADGVSSSAGRAPNAKSMKRMDKGLKGLIRMVNATLSDLDT